MNSRYSYILLHYNYAYFYFDNILKEFFFFIAVQGKEKITVVQPHVTSYNSFVCLTNTNIGHFLTAFKKKRKKRPKRAYSINTLISRLFSTKESTRRLVIVCCYLLNKRADMMTNSVKTWSSTVFYNLVNTNSGTPLVVFYLETHTSFMY